MKLRSGKCGSWTNGLSSFKANALAYTSIGVKHAWGSGTCVNWIQNSIPKLLVLCEKYR